MSVSVKNTIDNVVEIVRFETLPNIDEAAFILDNNAVELFLRDQPGFVYRSLCKGSGENEWIDIVYWASQSAADAAGKAFMSSTHTQGIMKYMNTEKVTMHHHPVMWQYYLAEETAVATS